MAVATVADGFISTTKTAYPYRTIHSGACKIAQRAKWGSKETVESLTSEFANTFGPRADVHSCLTHTEALTALYAAGRAEKDRRTLAKNRHKAIQALAVARTAEARLTVTLGTLSADEQAEYDRTVARIEAREWSPSSRDVDSFLFVSIPS